MCQPPNKKPRSWQVYSKDEGSSGPSKSTTWRWKHLFKETSEVHNALADTAEENVLEGNGSDSTNETSYGSAQHFQSDTSSQDSSDESAQDSQSDTNSQVSVDGSGQESQNDLRDPPCTLDTESVDEDVSSADFSDSNHSDDEEDRPLYNTCKLSVDEAVHDMLSDHINSHGTINSLKMHLNTFLKYIPRPNAMPKNTSQLFDYVLELAPTYSEETIYYCAKCFLDAVNTEAACRACNNITYNCFYTFSLEEQIRFYFEKCNLAEVLEKYAEKMSSHDEKIRDITDGSEYKRVRINWGKYSLTLLMNTDGVAINKNTSIWPVMFTICEVPAYLRERFMIVTAVWCDAVDPPMNTFLKPIVEAFRRIHNSGGVSWMHPETKTKEISEVYCPVICADAPARAKVQNIQGHGGKRSCNTCEQKTKRIGLSQEEKKLKAAGKKLKRRRAFVFQEVAARLRTDAQMRLQAKKAFNLPPKKNVKGVRGPSVIALIPKLDLSTCLYAEYMHGVCLGITRQFATLWFSVSGPWYLNSKKQEEINDFIKNIAPTSDIGRLLRGINKLGEWKASELRAWLLFYSLPCISNKLPLEYVQHWTLLVKAIFLLLQEEITKEDISNAEIMLRMFVRDIAHLYRYQDYSYNVHQLLHLALYVRRWGNLWSISAFKFESYNGILVNLVHGTKNPGKELMKNLRIAHGLKILRNKVYVNCEDLNREDLPFELLNAQDISKVPENEKIYLNDQFPEISQVYLRASKNKMIFTSKLYGCQRKRNNYTVRFKTSTTSGYAEIKYFIVHEGNMYAVLEKFIIKHTAMFTHKASGVRVSHVIPIDVTLPRDTLVANINDIVMKVIRVGNFVCYFPNKYERHNL